MTEEQWLTESTLEPLLAYLRQQPVTSHTQQQSFHFASGCLRLVKDRLDDNGRTLLAQFERLAEIDPEVQHTNKAGMIFDALGGKFGSLLQFALRSSGNMIWIVDDYAVAESRERGLSTEVQAELLRDIVGNPFRPVTFDPAWRTESVQSLVESIHVHKRNHLYPILGDALLDAGCRESSTIDHCHQKGRHFDQCWVLRGIRKIADV